MITIIDYGLGNLGSIKNMLKRIGHNSIITESYKQIDESEKIILPGVGSFDYALTQLKNKNLIELIHKKVISDKVPILGICLGMQLLTEKSEEGELDGFGFIKSKTRKFNFKEKKIKIPHMGWNKIKNLNECKLTYKFDDSYRFYFVHSYYVECDIKNNKIATTNYFGEFDSIINYENIYGVQFHPEKSHKYGMHLLSNFSKI